MLTHLRNHLCAQICAAVEHRHENTADLDIRICSGIAHLLDHAHNFDQTFQREVFALNRGQNFIGRCECVAHENSQ